MGAQNAKADLEEYRAGYPTLREDLHQKDNLRFYKGQIKSVPSGDFIDKIHEEWKGNYSLLERHHGYIQWLFPIREHGMNMQSQVLQLHEIEGIKSDPECKQRMLRSYELMLDFYGMKLKDPETGELERSEGYKARYRNLNSSGHNYLRITRILKSLGELGFEHLKFNFLAFVADEIWTHGELKNCKSSVENYWTGTLRDDTQRAEMEKRIRDFKKAAGDDDDELDRYSAYRRAGATQQRPGGGYGGGGYGGSSGGGGYRAGGYSSSAGGGRSGGMSAEQAHRAAAPRHFDDSDDSDEDTEEDADAQANANANVNANAGANANANANGKGKGKAGEAPSGGDDNQDEGEPADASDEDDDPEGEPRANN